MELAADLPYSQTDKELADFVKWLEVFMDSEKFQKFAEDFLPSRQL